MASSIYNKDKAGIQFYQPRELVFGDNCFKTFMEDFSKSGFQKAMIVADSSMENVLSSFEKKLIKNGIAYHINTSVSQEPSVETFKQLLQYVQEEGFDAIIGIGGGSVMDIAKLIAALNNSDQKVEEVFGIGKLKERKTFLACIPTTAGTGSEVSPNAILLDEKDNLKKGIVSKYLVPDISYVDPVLTYSVPPHITAATGLDALTHCIEAYANKYAHPVTDLYALQGIRLITHSIETAFKNGQDKGARSDLALGSLYGGLCLGPVNTAAVHALSYPLGGEYHIPHGVSNAMLLPFVMEKNLPEAASHYSEIGKVAGVGDYGDDLENATRCIEFIKDLCKKLEIPVSLKEFSISKGDIPQLTKSAAGVERLLNNNLRKLNNAEIFDIYYNLF